MVTSQARSIRYYLLLDDELRRLPLRAFERLLSHAACIPSLADDAAGLLEVTFHADKSRPLRMVGSTCRFDANGLLDMREAVECLPACIGWRRSSQEKSSVVNISQLLALRAWTRRNRWQPAKWHRANVLADINGIRRLTAVSVFPVSHRSASVL